MKILSTVERYRKAIEISFEELKQGKWLELVPDNEALKIEYKRKEKILIIKECNVKKQKNGNN